MPNFHIYKSSAGSGKTYTLAKSYLKLALEGKGKFRQILGVTFTNKATEEMKQRIIKFLSVLKIGEDKRLSEELCKDLQIDEATLKKRSSDLLSEILHDYSRFAVVTIDSFFHQVIRSFAREMGLQGTFSIDLETDAVLQQVIDRMLAEIGEEEHKEIKSWLTQFAEEKVEDGTSWDFRRDIAKLAKEVLSDNFKPFADELNELTKTPKELKSIKKELDQVQFSFEKQIEKICNDALGALSAKDLSVEDFKGKSKSPAGLFTKFLKKDYEISDNRRAATDNIEAWLTKKNQDNEILLQALSETVLPKYNELINYFDKQYVSYVSAVEVKRYFYTFGILSYINHYLQIYRDENDVMLISDLPDFLGRIIGDSDTPYIYEKVGSRFDNYLIDEFQDTSAFQWNNFKPLVKNAADQGQFSMVVGDVKQSIYRFRGGDWTLLQNQVKQDIGEALTEENKLLTNWRSSGNLVTFNNDIFSRLKGLIKDKYFDEQSEELEVLTDTVLASFDDVSQALPQGKNEKEGLVELSLINVDKEDKYHDIALDYTIMKVEDLQRSGYQLRDIALLVRNSREGKALARAFIEYGNSKEADPNLRYDVVSKEALYLTSSHIVQFIISVIKWLHNEKDKIELAHWFSNYQKYLIGSGKDEGKLYLELDSWEQNVPTEFVKKRHQLKSLPLYELVEELCRIFELSKIKEEYTYLQGFQDAVLDYSKNERGDITAFLLWWEEVRKKRSIIISDDNNAVKIITIHKAKGLEFPVVILPFLNWSLDNTGGFNDEVLWCKPVDKEPFNKMPVIPLKYGKSLKDSYWAAEYHYERLKVLLDSLNVLYVALTRPENALYMAGPKNKDGNFKCVNDVLFELLSSSENYDQEAQTYRMGSLPNPKPSEYSENEVSLQDYRSNNWRTKVQLQMKNAAAESEGVFNEAAARGIKLHEMLSRIKTKDQLSQFTNEELYSDLSKTVETLEDFFNDKWQIRTEVPVLLPNGDFKRIDRVNQNENQIILTDYKTGSQRQKDVKQMEGYIAIMHEMTDMPVKGQLLYLENQELVKVEGKNG